MNARLGLLLAVGFFGFVATLGLYLLLFFVQIQNADYACESPGALPGVKIEQVRGIGFQNSLLNLGGSCAYHMEDGSVVHAREPGWWFSGSIAGFAAFVVAVAVLIARRKGYSGMLFGIATLLAPPMGLALSFAAPRKGSSQGPAAL